LNLARDILISLLAFYAILTVARNVILRNDITVLSEVVKTRPRSAFARNRLGLSFRQRGLLFRAMQEHRAALSLEPASLEAYNSLGVVYAELGRYNEAISFFKQAINIDPQSAIAYYSLGITFFRMKNLDESRRVLEQALAINPAYTEAKELLAEINKKKGR
jgi:superkiller protein 3